MPTRPGVVSACGLLQSDIRYVLQKPFLRPLGLVDPAELRAAYAPLMREIDAAFGRDEIDAAQREIQPLADLRYQGQMHELTVPMPNGTLESWWSAAEVFEAFRVQHEREFGFADASIPAEIVNLRVKAVGHVRRPDVHAGVPASRRGEVPKGSRRVYLGPRIGHVRAEVIQRSSLGEGDSVHGPVIVTQPDTTVFALPGQALTVIAGGVLRIRETEAAA